MGYRDMIVLDVITLIGLIMWKLTVTMKTGQIY